MTADWWDLHYLEMMDDVDVALDPREVTQSAQCLLWHACAGVSYIVLYNNRYVCRYIYS